MVVLGCASAPTVADTPTVRAVAPENMAQIGLRTGIVLPPTMEQELVESQAMYRQLAEADPVERPMSFRLGAGLRQACSSHLGAIFRESRVVPDVESAMHASEDFAKAELVVWPQISKKSIEDDGRMATAVVGVSVLLLDGEGRVVERLLIEAKGTSHLEVPAEELPRNPTAAQAYSVKSRMKAALDEALNHLVAQLDRQLPQHPILDRVAARATTADAKRIAIRVKAASTCAEGGNDLDRMRTRYGFGSPTVARTMDGLIATLRPAEQLQAYLIGCTESVESLEQLLQPKIAAIDELTKAGEYGKAREALKPLGAFGADVASLKAAQGRLEEAVRRKKAEEERVEAERVRHEEEARAAAELAQKQVEADELAASARALLKRHKHKEAALTASRALAILPGHIEARAIVEEVQRLEREAEAQRQQRERERAQKAAKAHITKLRRQYPALVKQCERAREDYGVAQQKMKEAATSGRPELIDRMRKMRDQAASAYFQSQVKVRQVIQSYRDEGLQDVAREVERRASVCQP